MRGWSFGVSVLGLLLGVGCGKTHVNSNSHAGEPAAGGEGGGSDVGNGGSLATAGAGAATGAAAGAGGGPMLPPDGEIPAAVALHKLDLLLMIDNSRDMRDKQALLKNAVTWLLGADGPGLSADDIHVGVVTSSLGSHGAAGPKDVCVQADDDDHAHLIGSLRPGVPTFQNSGFLAWGPDAEPRIDSVLAALDPMIDTVGEIGCGYEASLEAWYRFLVDPEPPSSVVVPQGSSTAVAQGIDATILAQRAAFLRPDSVLSIIMLSDENDCSIRDEGYGWLIARSAPMYRATSACSNPNDPCCQSCGEAAANAGCAAIASDSACAQGTTLPQGEDDLNLRCWEQKRRFGFDLLYPISRYREGLTRQLVFQRSTGQAVGNPIFAGGAARRHPSQVILTGIVGVPWQDLADKTSLAGTGLTNLTAAQLTQQGRWDIMLGDPEASPPVRPADPFMIETTIDRAMLSSVSKHPLVAASLTPSSSNDPQANPINGHESVNVGSRTLQQACIFPLATPKLCDQAALDADLSCRCFADDAPYSNAICQPPAGGAASTTQYYASAYPGIRHLQLLKALGNNAITGSICPKVTVPDSPDFGYLPIMKVLAARLESAFNP
jgi:hypothetical protein